MVLVIVDQIVAVQDATGILHTAGVVVCIRASQWKIRSVPGISVIEDGCHDSVHAESTGEGICLCPEWNDKG